MTKFGFSLVVRGNDATPDTFAAIAERAEALALDSLWLSAHVILPPQVKSGYVLIPGRSHPEHWKERYWEPFTVMSYLAGLTSKLTLGTSVLVLPQHNPFEVAKQVAEVDQLTGGRVIFGIGVGWFEEEFEVLGQDFKNRGKRTDEALELMQRLWRDEPVTFKGRYYACENARFAPKPVQQPRPPIWVAGRSKAALRRTARYADAFHPVRPSFEYMVECRRDLDRMLAEEGRKPEAVQLAAKLPIVFRNEPAGADEPPTIGTPQAIVDALKRYQELGSSHFVLDVVPEKRQVALDTMERFAQEVRPKL
jgi:probable F420-dependent oxidoreductase